VVPSDLFVDYPLGIEVFERVRSCLDGFDDVEIRITRSQVAFRRRRGFAYLWPPGKYLTKPDVDVVLSIALGRQDASPRWKEVVHPYPKHWMHHLEIRDVAEIDAQVVDWLLEAANCAE